MAAGNYRRTRRTTGLEPTRHAEPSPSDRREMHDARSDGVRRRHRRRRPGGPRGGDPPEAARRRAGSARSRVCVLEKGSEVGAHILSGAVIDPRALNELLPDWKAQGAPLDTPVTEDRFLILTRGQGVSHSELAAAAADEQPRQLHREPRQRVPLARAAGRSARRRDLSRASPRPKCCSTTSGAVRGVATGDMGVASDGTHKPEYQPGMELHAKYTLFAEGCRGSLSQELMHALQPARRRRSAEVRHRPQGAVAGRAGQASARASCMHTPGLAARYAAPAAARSSITSATTSSRSDSSSTSTTRTRTCRRTTSSSASRRTRRSAPTFEGGKRLAYGARAINEGGLQSVPKLAFPGGALIGCAAGLRQPAAHQGHAQRDEDRHARRRSRVRGARRGTRARRARRRTPTRGASRGSTRTCTRCATSSRGSSGACGPARCTAACTCG